MSTLPALLEDLLNEPSNLPFGCEARRTRFADREQSPGRRNRKTVITVMGLRLLLVLVAILAFLPSGAVADWGDAESHGLQNYDGTIGAGHRVRMTLVFHGPEINGLYFHATQLRDIPLRGRIVHGTDILLEELDDRGSPQARLIGSFPSRDPRGGCFGHDLQREVIVGCWQKLDSPERLPVYLSLESATAGTLTNRYAMAGADDDEQIHRNAHRFWISVERGDKKAVAALVAYPLLVNLPTGRKSLRGPADLVAHYDAIFTPEYRAAIAHALPRHMFVRCDGIMLGHGEVWFGPDGRVIALNNP